MRIVVTGAGGFVGRALVERLLESDVSVDAETRQVILIDLSIGPVEDPRVRVLERSFGDTGALTSVFEEKVDLVFHLASVPGGTAERDYVLGRHVNLDATLRLVDACCQQESPPGFVFASSIAVYGDRFPSLIDEQTLAKPATSYGAHKLMTEIMLADATRRGHISGCSLRLPGVVARPAAPSGLVSAFMSELFWSLRDRRPITLPVSADATTWWISRERCVDNLWHAGRLVETRQSTSPAYVMPVLHLSMKALLDAIATRFSLDWADLVSFRPDPHIEALFGSYPPLQTPNAEAAGFRSDGDISQLLDRVYG